MARTEQAVRSLVEEEDGMADALEAVIGATEDGTVSWTDLSDDISSGQWGRLIETGVLTENEGDGGDFRIADREAVNEALGPSTPTEVDEESSSWSTFDKVAAVGAVGLFAGYSWNPMRSLIGGVVDVLLGPLEAMLPFYAVVLVLALFTGLYSTLLQANLMDMEKMGVYQERMKEIQERQKDAKERGDEEALEQIREEQMEAMGDNLGMFKEQFRPMVWIMLLTIPVFLWMFWRITSQNPAQMVSPGQMVLPLFGEIGWREGVVGPIQAWIVWYFVCSMGFTQVIRKSLNIQTTPT